MISALTGIDANKNDGTKVAVSNTQVALSSTKGGTKQTRLSEDYSAVAGVMGPSDSPRENFQIITF